MKKKSAPTTQHPKRKTPHAARPAAKTAVRRTSTPAKASPWLNDKLFRKLIENSNETIILSDPKGKILYRSPSAKRISGVPDAKVLSAILFDWILPQDVKPARHFFAEMLKNPGKKIPFQIRLKNPNGDPCWIDGTGVNWLAKPGLQALVIDYRDVTEAKGAAAALISSEDRYRNLFENARLGIFQCTPEGKFLRVNKEFARMFGYLSPEDVFKSVKNVATDIYVDPSRRGEIIRSQAKDPALSLFESLYRRKDGSAFWGRLHLRPATDSQGTTAYYEGFIEDISKNRAMEETLRESEEKFRSIFQNSPAGVALVGLDGRYLAVNPAFCEIFGYTANELLAFDFFGITHPEDIESSGEVMRGVLKNGGKAVHFNKRYVHKDGHTVWAEVNSALVNGADGNPSHFITHVIDVTKQKQTEESLRKSEAHYRTLVEASPVAICITDLNGKITMCNLQAAKLLGYERPEELFGKGAFELFHPDEVERAGANLQKTLREGIVRNIQYHLIKKDGSRFPAELTAASIPDAEGKTVAFMAVVQDISERDRAEEALRESEEQYRQLVEQTVEGILVLDPEGNFIFVNPALCTMLGYTCEEMLRLNVLDTYPEALREEGRTRTDLIRSGKPQHFERSMKRKDGTLIMIEGTGVRLANGNMQGIMHDITGRKQAEEELRESEERYRLLFELSPDSICVYQDGIVLYANPATLRLLGMGSLQEILGKQILEFVHPDYRDLVIQRTQKQERNGKVTAPVEEKFIRRDGGFVDVEVLAAPFQYRGKLSHLVISRDISDRKRADEILREKEERFRATFENANVGVCIVGLDGRLLQVNQQMSAMFGYPREELEEMTVSSIAYPDDADISPAFMQQAISGEVREAGFDKRYIHKDGHILWGHVSSSLVRDPQGHPLYFISHVQDVTERKQMEGALRESKNQFSNAAVIARLGPWEYDVEKDLFTFNDQFYAVFKTTAAAMGGYMMKSADYSTRFVHPDDRKDVGAKIREALETDDPNFNLQLEHRVINADGTIGYISVHFFIIKDAKGKTIKTYGVNQDITERKQAEETLRGLAMRHEALLSAIPEIVMEVDNHKIYIWANRAGEEFFGEDVVGKEADFYFEGEQDTYKTVQPLFSGSEDTIYVESWQRRKDGEKRLLAWWCRNLKDDRGNITGALSSARDITEQRKSEEQIRNLSRFPEENPNPVMRMTPEGELLYANPASRPFLTYWDIGIGRPVPEEYRAPIREVFAAHQAKVIETHLGERIFRCTITPVVEGGYVNMYARDITDRRRAEEEVTRQTEELRQRNLELGRVNELTERRMQQLAAMRTVDMAISSSFKSELVMEILLEQLTSQLRVHAADILIFQPAMQGFRFFCGRGFYAAPSTADYLRLSDSYAGRAAQERRMIKVPRLDEKADQAKIFPKIAKEGFVSYACLPLIAKGQIKGVMEVCQRESLDLGPEEDSFLEMLAGQAAIAIDNAEMFGNLQSSRDELQLAFNSTLGGWARALEMREHETEGETQRSADMAMRLAQMLGESDDDLTQLYRGSILHDVGMISIPEGILLKRGPLTSEEWAIVRKHPQVAFDLLSPVLFLRMALDIPHCHHERWDGSGYPRGLKGDHIPLAARIFAVVDVWNALRSDRPYRKAWTDADAGDYLRKQSGKQFDPAIIQSFFRLIGGQ